MIKTWLAGLFGFIGRYPGTTAAGGSNSPGFWLARGFSRPGTAGRIGRIVRLEKDSRSQTYPPSIPEVE